MKAHFPHRIESLNAFTPEQEEKMIEYFSQTKGTIFSYHVISYAQKFFSISVGRNAAVGFIKRNFSSRLQNDKGKLFSDVQEEQMRVHFLTFERNNNFD